MTIVRAIDGNHDWLLGQGLNDYLSGSAEVGQDINTRLLSFLNNCFFDLNAGIDWFNLLGGKNQLAIQLAISAMILNTAGVTALLALNLNLNDLTRGLSGSYQVQTVYSVYNGNFTLSINSAS